MSTYKPSACASEVPLGVISWLVTFIWRPFAVLLSTEHEAVREVVLVVDNVPPACPPRPYGRTRRQSTPMASSSTVAILPMGVPWRTFMVGLKAQFSAQ